MWSTIAEAHAALNDLAPALFIAAVVFEILGYVTKRESLTHAGYWALIGAAAGAVVAVWSGLGAEDVIEHGSVVHRTIERHQTLAITFTIFAIIMTAWRVWKGPILDARRFKQYLAFAAFGTIAIVWTAKVGGRIMFDHAGGIQTRILQSALTERAAGHVHEPGEEHADEAEHADADDHAADESPEPEEAADHTHP